MEVLLCWLVGILFGISVYLLLNRNLIRVLFGIIMISTSINLLIFTVGRLTKNAPAFIKTATISTTVANALPQAMILTAIVIGFGIMALSLILITQTWQALGTMDSDQLQESEPAATSAKDD